MAPNSYRFNTNLYCRTLQACYYIQNTNNFHRQHYQSDAVTRVLFFFFSIPWFYSMANKIMQNHSTSKDTITLNEVLYHNTGKNKWTRQCSTSKALQKQRDILGREFINNLEAKEGNGLPKWKCLISHLSVITRTYYSDNRHFPDIFLFFIVYGWLPALLFNSAEERIFTGIFLISHLIFDRVNRASVSVPAGQPTDLVSWKRKSGLMMWHLALSCLRSQYWLCHFSMSRKIVVEILWTLLLYPVFDHHDFWQKA